MLKSDERHRPLYRPLPIDPGPLAELIRQRQMYEAVAAAAAIGIFDKLRTAKAAGELAAELAIDDQAVFYLLKVLAHMGCLRENDGTFAATPLAETYLSQNSYLYLGQEFGTGPAGAPPPGSLAERLRGVSGKKTPEPAWNQERLRQIGVLGLMGSIQATVAACDLSAARRLLDLGGGHGFYSIAFAQKYPDLQVTMFDLPHIATLAEHFVKMFAVEKQVALAGGDFLTDDIGTGFDAVLCANILHSDKRHVLLPKVRQALSPGGQVILKCRVADSADNLENALAKLRWRVYGGRELHATAEWLTLLDRHGFRDVKPLNITGIYATITGVR